MGRGGNARQLLSRCSGRRAVHGDGAQRPTPSGRVSPNHNFSIYIDASISDQLFYGDLVFPGESTTYDVTALSAGLYVFRCDIHPEMMTGVLLVG